MALASIGTHEALDSINRFVRVGVDIYKIARI